MMKKALLLIFSYSIILSCQSISSKKTTEIISTQKEEIELISQIIPLIVKPNPFPKDFKWFNSEIESQQEFNERLKNAVADEKIKADQIEYTLAFSPELVVLTADEKIHLTDTMYGRLAKALLTDSLENKLVDFNKINALTDISLYKVLTKILTISWVQFRFRELSSIWISRKLYFTFLFYAVETVAEAHLFLRKK